MVVEVVWPVEELQAGEQNGAAGLEVVGGVCELVRDVLLALPNLLEPALDLVLRPFRVSDEVE